VTLSHLKVFLWIIVFIALLELGLEVRAKQRGWDTMVFGFPPPMQSASSKQDGKGEFGPTPAFPFRSRIVPLERESGNHRYWVASSSHAEDIYLTPPMIFPNILEGFLKESKINAVVLNASRAGLDIPGNVDDLKRRGPEWKPDYAILYQMSLSIGSIAKHVLGSPAQGASAKASDAKEGPITWINRLVEKTTIYANVKGQITARIGASRVLANGLGLQAEQEFTAMLRDFIGVARSIGSVPVLTTFATSHTRKHLGDIPQDIALGLFKYSSILSVEGWVASVEQFNAAVKRVAIEERVLLIDVEDAVAGHPEYFRDFVHFTPAGHEAVAKAMGVALLHVEQEKSMAPTDRERAAP
jgi:hypothetical protein